MARHRLQTCSGEMDAVFLAPLDLFISGGMNPFLFILFVPLKTLLPNLLHLQEPLNYLKPL